MSLRLLSVGSLPPEWGGQRTGGVATFHATLLAALRAPRYDIEVVGVVVSDISTRPAPVPVYGPARGQNRLEFLREVLARTRPDVILLHHFGTQNGLLLAQLVPEIPLVGIAHSWHAVTFASDTAIDAARARMIEAMAGLRAIVLVSEHCRREGVALGFDYPGMQATIHYPVQAAFAAPLDLRRERSGVVFLGNLEHRKRPGALVEAIALIEGLQLTVIGRGPEERAVQVLTTQLGLEDRVSIDSEVLGPSPRLLALLAEAEVMCLPSSSESFGIAYIEALACGTPIVGFGPTVSEIAQTMGIPIGESLHDGSPGEIAAAIERVRLARWDRDRLRCRALELFSPNVVAARYAELLIDVGGA